MRNFLIFVLVPIVVIYFSAIGVIKKEITTSSENQVKLAQQNFIDSIDDAIINDEIKLGQLLFSDNDTVLQYASTYFAKKDQAQKYDAQMHIETLTNYVISPFPNFEGLSFHATDNSKLVYKNPLETMIDVHTLDCWHLCEQAINQSFASIFYHEQLTKRIPVAICLKTDPTQYPLLNKICYFVLLPLPEIVRDYEKNETLGTMYVLNGQKNTIYCTNEQSKQFPYTIDFTKPRGSFRTKENQKLLYFITQSQTVDITIVNIVDYNTLLRPYKNLLQIIIPIVVILLFFAFIYLISLYKNVIKPINNLVEGMDNMEKGDWITPVEGSGYLELRELTSSFNSLKIGAKKARDTEKSNLNKLHKLEIKALQSQINPHFMVNCLESIKFMAHLANYETMEKMAQSMIIIVSASFRKNAGDYTLKQELDVLESFIYIARIRNNGDFEVQYEIENGLENMSVPRLFLQPFIDNAIKYGNTEERQLIIHVAIHLVCNKTMLHVEIRDNGCGMTQNKIDQILHHDPLENGNSIGIVNMKNRLKLRYKEHALFQIHSEINKGTSLILEFPATTKEETYV